MDKQTKDQLDSWIVSEILKNKAVWLHAVYSSILPRELYWEASRDQMERATKYAKAQGYTLHDYPGRTEMHKGELIVGVFRPHLTGEGDDRKLTFEATIFGKPVPTAAMVDRHLPLN